MPPMQCARLPHSFLYIHSSVLQPTHCTPHSNTCWHHVGCSPFASAPHHPTSASFSPAVAAAVGGMYGRRAGPIDIPER